MATNFSIYIFLFGILSLFEWVSFIHVFILLHPVGFGPRLLRPLHLGVPVLRVPDSLQHGGDAGLVRRLHIGGLLLLLLRRRHGRRLQLPLRHGLRHHGRLLRVFRLPGILYGVLRHLLPHIGGGLCLCRGDNWTLGGGMEGNCCCCHFEFSSRRGICVCERPFLCECVWYGVAE